MLPYPINPSKVISHRLKRPPPLTILLIHPSRIIQIALLLLSDKTLTLQKYQITSNKNRTESTKELDFKEKEGRDDEIKGGVGLSDKGWGTGC